MTPGPVEEGSKAAVGIIEALKSQPLCLVLLLSNLALLFILYIILTGVKEQRAADQQALYRSQTEVLNLMSKCYVPPPPKGAT